MINNFKEYLNFLADKQITPNQFAICWVIYFKHSPDVIEGVKKYFENVEKFKKEGVEALVKKGYIEPLFKGDSCYEIGNLLTTLAFSEDIFIDGEDAFQEIIDIYPSTFEFKEARPPYKKITVFTNAVDLEKMERLYSNILNSNKGKHRDIVTKTKKFVKLVNSGQIQCCKLDKYIMGRLWNSVPEDDSLQDNKKLL